VKLARTLLERFSRNRVLRRRLPEDFGSVPVLVSPDASLRFWKLRVESDLFEFARDFVRPGGVVWDVGANVGLLSVAAAQRAGASGKVIAMEADIWLACLLRKSAAMQPASSAQIQVIPVAISDSPAVASFHVAQRCRAGNFLDGSGGSSQTGGVRETVSVLTITLDWLLEQEAAPNVVKIDVEGAESYVFRGAQRLIAEAQPVILCEVRDRTRNYVAEVLLRNGYTLFDWDVKPRVAVNRASFNILAIPPDRHGEWHCKETDE
jgi:FkbM family methyltransferase